MAHLLDQLAAMTVVVADTGEIDAIRQFTPRAYNELIDRSLRESRQVIGSEAAAEDVVMEALDEISVTFGKEILKIVPGRVSTEVDARLSYDTEATIAKAHKLIGLYQQAGIGKERVLIKIAATWEGIAAARELEQRGIHTNLTLLFSFGQALACGQAGVQLISPFVGRIYDWHKKAAGSVWVEAEHVGPNDPGVLSVKQIFDYYKRFGIRTEVMGASFRNVSQVLALAGCDLLTISPELLAQLAASDAPVARALDPAAAQALELNEQRLDEPAFRLALNQDAMATEKLAEGIRAFVADAIGLEQLLQAA